MNDLDVRIVELAPMRVASFLGFGESPEGLAIEKLMAWARPRGLLEGKPRIFGFNNPSPSAGSPNYGYELWLAVGPEVQGDGEAQIKQFEGGRFAVTRCGPGPDVIFPAWQRLAAWVDASEYRARRDLCLEEQISRVGGPVEELMLDLYEPIE